MPVHALPRVLSVRVATFAALLAVALPTSIRADETNHSPFAGLSGTWTGNGSVLMSDGSQERIRCRATYSVPPLGQVLNQGLRCASDSYTIDVRSNVMASSGGALSGTWSEATRQVSGDLSGSVTPGHIQTSVEALGFSAQLSITTVGARQSVSLKPEGMDVQAVTIEMRRI